MKIFLVQNFDEYSMEDDYSHDSYGYPEQVRDLDKVQFKRNSMFYIEKIEQTNFVKEIR